MYLIVSTHAAFGKLYLGRGRPVAKKSAALRFSTEVAATERVMSLREIAERNPEEYDAKFFGNLQVVPA